MSGMSIETWAILVYGISTVGCCLLLPRVLKMAYKYHEMKSEMRDLDQPHVKAAISLVCFIPLVNTLFLIGILYVRFAPD